MQDERPSAHEGSPRIAADNSRDPVEAKVANAIGECGARMNKSAKFIDVRLVLSPEKSGGLAQILQRRTAPRGDRQLTADFAAKTRRRFQPANVIRGEKL